MAKISYFEFATLLELKCKRAAENHRYVGKTCCPLGVITESRFPEPGIAACHWDITFYEAQAFARGYDGDPLDLKSSSNIKIFYELGQHYQTKYKSHE